MIFNSILPNELEIILKKLRNTKNKLLKNLNFQLDKQSMSIAIKNNLPALSNEGGFLLI